MREGGHTERVGTEWLMERGGEMQDSSHYNGRACLDLPNGNAVIKLDS